MPMFVSPGMIDAQLQAADDNFGHIIERLQELPSETGARIREFLWMDAVPVIERDAKSHEGYYNNDTGATEASTVAYVALEEEIRDEALDAVAAANELRPGSGDEEIPITQTGAGVASLDLMLDVMSATNYSYHLNTRRGLESMYLSDALLYNVGSLEIAMMNGGEAALIEIGRP